MLGLGCTVYTLICEDQVFPSYKAATLNTTDNINV